MFGSRKNVVVLGAGPAGLLAAEAAAQAGANVSVFSRGDERGPVRSELHGCQYLHAAIPHVTMAPGTPVRYILGGTTEQYRRKVYGAGWNGQVSPDEYGPEANHLAWNLRTAYDRLWERWSLRITPIDLTPRMAAEVTKVRGQVVLCTVPAQALCLRPDEHKFLTQDIWAMGERSTHWREFIDEKPTLPHALPYRAPENTVQCNGEDAPRWYRAATVFGHSTLEWPAGPKPPIPGVVAVHKPLRTDCDCHVGKRWHRLGRYGTWRQGVLTHEVFFEAQAVLS